LIAYGKMSMHSIAAPDFNNLLIACSTKEECLNAEPLFLKLTDIGVLLKGIKCPLDITFKTKLLALIVSFQNENCLLRLPT
jgi:hypothetical protein